MKKKIYFKDGIIDGETVREVVSVFPELETQFTQRKSYDEYYYEPMEVKFSIAKIEKLLSLYITLEICQTDVTIND